METKTKVPETLVHSFDENLDRKGHKCLHCGYKLPRNLHCEDYATLAVKLSQGAIEVFSPSEEEEDFFDCRKHG